MMRNQASPFPDSAVHLDLRPCRVARLLVAMAWSILAAPSRAETAKAPAESAVPAARGAAPAIAENRAEITAFELDSLPAQVPVASARRANPMAMEMRNALDVEQKALVELRARFMATRDPKAALEIQREIERVKTGTELALLRIQAAFAAKAGRLEDARRIEAEIDDLVSPKPALAPQQARRPSPSPTGAPR